MLKSSTFGVLTLAIFATTQSALSYNDAIAESYSRVETKPTIIALNAVGPVSIGSSVKGTNYLKAAQKAAQKKDRHHRMLPSIPDRMVEKDRQQDKILILGGSDVLPM